MDDFEYIDDKKREAYKVYLEWQSKGDLIGNYFKSLTKEELIVIITDADPLGDEDCCFEGSD